MAQRHTKPYPAEFKRTVVELVRAGRSPEDVSKELGPSAQSIRTWVARADADAGKRRDVATTDEREELRKLRKENRQLRPRLRGSLTRGTAAPWCLTDRPITPRRTLPSAPRLSRSHSVDPLALTPLHFAARLAWRESALRMSEVLVAEVARVDVDGETYGMGLRFRSVAPSDQLELGACLTGLPPRLPSLAEEVEEILDDADDILLEGGVGGVGGVGQESGVYGYGVEAVVVHDADDEGFVTPDDDELEKLVG